MPGKEFRKSRRFLVRECTVQCRALGLKSLLHKTHEAYLPVLSLSVGGGQLLTESALKVGERIDLSLEAPDLDGPIKMRAVIKWVEQLSEEELFRAGVAFVEVLPETQQALQALGESLWPRQQELLDAGLERLRLSSSLARKLNRAEKGHGTEAVARWHSRTQESPAAAEDEPPVEEAKTEAAGVVADSPEAVDALLSKAISKQKSHGKTKTRSASSAEGRVALIEVHDRVLQADLLIGEDDDAPINPERTVARYLEIFVKEGRECCAHRLADDSMTSARPPSFARGCVVVFVKGAMPMSGDFALVETDEALLFRRVFMGDGDTVRLRPLNPRYPEAVLPRSDIIEMSRAAGRYDPL